MNEKLEILRKLKDIIFTNQGLSSYELLAKYIAQGNTYTAYGDFKFENLLEELKKDSKVIYNESKDIFSTVVIKPVSIAFFTETPPKSCTNCRFCHNTNQKDYNFPFWEDPKKDEPICLLDPSVKIYDIQWRTFEPATCPLSKLS